MELGIEATDHDMQYLHQSPIHIPKPLNLTFGLTIARCFTSIIKCSSCFGEVSWRALERSLVGVDNIGSRDGGYRIPIPDCRG